MPVRLSCLTAVLCVGLAAAEEKPKETPVEDALKERLKPLEAKLLEARAAMLKECDDEIKKLDEQIKKAHEVVTDPKSDRDARTKAAREMGQAQGLRAKLHSMRVGIEMRYHVPSPPRKPPTPPEDYRLGIATQHPGTLVIAQLGLKKDEGLVIEQVYKNSPAEKAGLKQYDILVKLDGKAVANSATAMRKILAEIKPETPFEAVVIRQGKQETVKGLAMPALAGNEPKKPETNKTPDGAKPVEKDRPNNDQ
jgi:hypothetical protein